MKRVSKMWNLWHGCHKTSEGCRNCYVFRGDARYDRDSDKVFKTAHFDLPTRKKKNGEYTCPSGTLFWTCFTSDFFLEDCDSWRKEVWEMIRERADCKFFFITKRIDRMQQCMPADFAQNFAHVSVGCTCENQKMASYRLQIFKNLPIKDKVIICEPLLEEVDLSSYLDDSISLVVAGGESGNEARVCENAWIEALRAQCVETDTRFWFKQTGAKFQKDGKLYNIPRKLQHSQARKSGLSYKYSSYGDFLN